MTDMTPEMEALVGKVIGDDITEEEIVDMFPEYVVRILNLSTLALANFNPERLRVWHDNSGKIAKVVLG